MKNIDITRRQEYEIDPNSAFSKLKRLQKNLKSETALKEMYNKNKEEVMKNIDNKCYEYYRNKIAIKEIYDKANKIKINEEHKKEENEDELKDELHYKLVENSQNELPQCHDPLNKLLILFRENNDLLLKFLEYLDKSQYDQIANFLCHYFYTNIFSPKNQTDSILVLIYLLLEKEIDKIDSNTKSTDNFLNGSFLSILLKSLTRKNDIRNYLNSVVGKLVYEFEGIADSNQENNFFSLDIEKIKEFAKNNLLKMKPNKTKQIEPLKIINEQIHPCFLKENYDELFGNNNKKKNDHINFYENDFNNPNFNNIGNLICNNCENNDNNANQQVSMFYEINKINLGIYLMKSELFDSTEKELSFTEKIARELSLSGIKDINIFKKISKNSDKNDNTYLYELDEKAFNNLISKQKSINNNNDTTNTSNFGKAYSSNFQKPFANNNLSNTQNNNNSSNILSKTSLFSNNNNLNKNNTVNNNSNNNNSNNVNNKINISNYNKEYIAYLQKHLEFIKKNKDAFSINKLIQELDEAKTKEYFEKLVLIYKYSFEKLKFYMDELFYEIIENINSTPYIIKCICLIIDKLISKKFPNDSIFIKYDFIGKFLFEIIILPLLSNPSYNGILLKNRSLEGYKELKVNAISLMLSKLNKGDLFVNTNKNEYFYSIMNYYLIELTPFLFGIYNNFTNIRLPNFIEKLITEKNNPKRNINFNYLVENPNEHLEHQSFCLTYTDYLIFYNILKNNDKVFFPDKNEYIYKTFNKLTYHEATIKKKMDNDKKKSIRSYLFFTKLNYSEKFNELLTSKKNAKFSFQTNSEMNVNENEVFILERVKFSINTIISHLNILTRANFEESESTQNFIKGLNKMLELEGFSELLKEKTIPLSWYGLYLSLNIENIPQSIKRANYSELYQQLEEESLSALNECIKDESLNLIYSKIKATDCLINIEKNNLAKLENFRKKLLVQLFISKCQVDICLYTMIYDDKIVGMYINTSDNCKEKSSAKEKNKKLKYDKKKSLHSHCNNIEEFIYNFPNLVIKADIDNLFDCEKSISLDLILDFFFNQISEEVNSEEMFYIYELEDLADIKKEIINIIHRKLYSKIFPEKFSKIDTNIFRQCSMLAWINICNFNPLFDNLDISLLNIAMEFVKKMDNEKCPFDKINALSKVFDIIDQAFEFNDIKIKDKFNDEKYISLFLYVIINSHPHRLSSNMQYINYCLTPEQKDEKNIKMISFLNKIIDKLLKFSYKSVKNISEEDFEDNMIRERRAYKVHS